MKKSAPANTFSELPAERYHALAILGESRTMRWVTSASGLVATVGAKRAAGTPVVLANSDLADTVRVVHSPLVFADRRVIGSTRVHAVCFSNSSGVAA